MKELYRVEYLYEQPDGVCELRDTMIVVADDPESAEKTVRDMPETIDVVGSTIANYMGSFEE